MLSVFATVLRRDLLLAWRRRADVLTALGFFLLVTSLFPLGVGPEPEQLAQIAAGVMWVAALLATLLSVTRLFESDEADGTLEQMLLSVEPLAVIVLAKVCAYWLLTGLPLVLIAPLIALQFSLSPQETGIVCATLLIGTPTLSLLGAVGAALTLGLRGGGALIALLVLPLYVPVLIFGAGAVDRWRAGLDVDGNFALLGACLLVSLAVAPLASAAALRIAQD
ncbi:heme exporter protein CcmB [Methyloversatilis thermotolerans]|uniref:heme exporter protein CcmB n=1 Tax=Methyloversatilis thermotolerans TaxID=1346290 RepID=UPI000373DEA6|nr:heme exporter protein CcmB [Methyloversatilis thermotolerans]